MEKQKYLYKNPKCVGGTSSTISLINAWLSMTGQRNMQKYRSLAYLGGFTIIAIATIWFLSQSPTYAIEYNSKDKSNKSNKPNKSEKSNNKFTKKNDDTNKSDKRNKSWWSSIREKIANKLGFGKKSKSQKLKTGKPSSSKIGRPGNKNRIVPTPPSSSSSSSSSSKTSDVKPNGSAGSSNIRNNTHDARSTNMSKKILRCSNSNNDDARQKGQVTQKIRDGSYGDNSSSNSNNLRQKDNGSLTCNNLHQKNNGSLTCNDLRQKDNGSLTCNNLRQKDSDNLTFNKVKQQSLRKLKLKAQESRPSSNYTNRGNKYRLGDCSISKPEKVNSTSATRNVKCPSKSDVDNKKSKHHLTDMETRISEAIKSINLIDLQVKEKHKEFYIPYTPLTLHETLDKIGQERIERYRKLLIKLGRQKQDDLSLELTLRMVQEFFKERKYYDTSEEGDDDDCHKKRVDNSDDFDDFFKELERTVKADRDNVACDKCPKFADVLAQDEQASRKRIERNLEFLKMIESYKQQGKETEANIKKSIEMFNEQKAQCKGKTRHLKRPFRFYEELKQFEDRLMDAEQQVKNLAESIDDMEEYFTKTLELFNDDGKMDTAVAKHGPILIDDV